MTTLREFLCRKFCHHRTSQAEMAQRASLPFELREASHKVSNAVMELEGSAAKVSREANAFLALANALARDNEKN